MHIYISAINLYLSQILIKIEFSRQIFEIYSDFKFHENPSSWVHIIPCGQVKWQTEIKED